MASTYLTRTISSGADVTAFTISVWVKRSGLGSTQRIFSNDTTDSKDMYFRFGSSDNIESYHRRTDSENVFNCNTNAVFRDISAWYHIVMTVDTTESTASDRFKLYVNGVSQTFSGTPTYPDLNEICNFLNTGEKNDIGYYRTSPGEYFDGSMAHFHLIQGTAYQASTFGETDSTSGIWKPKVAPSVTYGTNGFFLKFQDSSSLGDDSSGNTNDFTLSGNGRQILDTPSNIFCNCNKLTSNNASVSYTQGNTTLYKSSAAHAGVCGNLGVTAGKWYWEAKLDTIGSATGGTAIGITQTYTQSSSSAWKETGHNCGDRSYDWVYAGNGEKQNNSTGGSYGNTYTSGDIIGVALDLDNNYIYFSKNGTWQNSGDPTSGSSGTGSAYSVASGNVDGEFYVPLFGLYGGTVWNVNFGNGYFGTTAVASAQNDGDGYGKFEYSPPTGYYALCTKNINTYG